MNNINWKELPFSYIKTDYNVRCYFKNGKWSEPEISESEYLSMHMASTCLHYGQEAFEGQKAFMGHDGKIRVFRLDENAKRMRHSARGILMEEVPEQLFTKCVILAISHNRRFVPPYESGASLYIRPLLLGSGAEIGVKPSKEYTFIVFVSPVGPYFKEGFKPVNLVIYRDHDRAAPMGTGNIKIGGNYSASMVANKKAQKEGYVAVLYLDAKHKKYIEEAGPANFFGIKKNTYVTPESSSILPSITNKSLQQLAKDMGMNVERRPVSIEELNEFDEAGACGTAAVISPIGKIYDEIEKKTYLYSKDGKPGPLCTELYHKLKAIQYGDEEDIHNWNYLIE